MDSKLRNLAAYRFEKAVKNLEIAKVLIDDGSYDFSLNRSYYAVFNAIRAVNALDGFDSSKHSGVIAYFNQHYVKTGKFDTSLSAIIKQAATLREKSDYEDFFTATLEDAEDTLEQATELVHAIGTYLNPVQAK